MPVYIATCFFRPLRKIPLPEKRLLEFLGGDDTRRAKPPVLQHRQSQELPGGFDQLPRSARTSVLAEWLLQ